MKNYFLMLFVFMSSLSIGQVQTYFVKPVETDVNYSSTEDSSAISRNTSFQVNKLFLFFGGTNSSSSTDYNALRITSAELGFDFINLSYPNDVAAASLANDNDSLAFNKYRQELCFGTPVSDDVAVDTLNSIYTRALKLIQFLDQTYPAENWGQYLSTPNSLDWSKIIVGGHSQGSGHAAYLAKQFLVDRVLMFSGPNDYSNTFSNSANWLRQSGVTPTTRHFAYLSLNDEVVSFSKQFVNISGLQMLVNDDTTDVDNISTPYGNSRSLYTTQTPGIVILNHNVPIKLSAINQEVWEYMLTSEITTGLENDFELNNLNIYPNPADGKVTVILDTQDNFNYGIFDMNGQRVNQGQLRAPTNEINVSALPSGIYILKVFSVNQDLVGTVKLIKN